MQGIVHAIHRVKVADLEHISRREGHNFAPSYALAFGETALRWMLQIARQWAGRHVRFTYCPESSTIAATVLPDGDLPSRVQHALSNNDV